MADRKFDDALRDLETGPEDAPQGEPSLGAAADPATHAGVAAMRERFGDAVLHHTIMAGDEHVVYVAADRIVDVLGWLQGDEAQRYDLLLDVTAVDYGSGRPLEVVYQLWSIPNRRALRVKATLPLTALEIDSVTGLWKTADWLEREAYDLFGIHFRGHPDLRRIMMPDNYAEGHPLRKDFPLRGRFTRSEQTRRALAMGVEDVYTPAELELGRMPAPAGEPRELPGPAAAAEATEGRPNDEQDWSLGTSGSAAGGAPGPEGAQP
ncbi:MAG TPA: NADH-quinone oxidoreductase subunit C [Longimicrobiales bacterium]|nr:NADH-quinone oxidoreductase subunit C [Longimicrobiales bacterium]